MPEWIRIRIKDFYTDAVGEEEFTLVAPEVYEALAVEFKRAADAQRKRDERNRAPIYYEDGETDDLLMFRQESLEEQVLRKLEIHMLQKAMQELTETQRKRLQLYFFAGYTYAEIAKEQGVSEHSVRMSVESAIRHLKELLIEVEIS